MSKFLDLASRCLVHVVVLCSCCNYKVFVAAGYLDSIGFTCVHGHWYMYLYTCTCKIVNFKSALYYNVMFIFFALAN